MQKVSAASISVLAVMSAARRFAKGALGVFAAGLLCCLQTSRADEASLAPDFALRSVDGRVFRLSEYRGEVVVMSFWAQWCGECRYALSALDEIYSKYRKAGLVVLSINVEDEAKAAAAAKTLKIPFPVLVDERKEVGALYKLTSLPVTVIVDRDGQIQYSRDGYQRGDEQEWSEQVRRQLNK